MNPAPAPTVASPSRLFRYAIVVLGAILTCALSPAIANAACIFAGGFAGQNIAYRYATAYFSSFLNADKALSRTANVPEILDRPARDRPTMVANFSEALKELELAARDFDCAASAIRPYEQFPVDRSSESALEQSKMAQQSAVMAGVVYAGIGFLNHLFL